MKTLALLSHSISVFVLSAVVLAGCAMSVGAQEEDLTVLKGWRLYAGHDVLST